MEIINDDKNKWSNKNKTQKNFNKNKASGFSNRSNVLLMQSNT
jgi:hypothetical protein